MRVDFFASHIVRFPLSALIVGERTRIGQI
jgi:hypothetical protein